MKKINFILILLTLFSSTSCSSIRKKEMTFEVKVDYGTINEEHVTYLLDDCEIFFDSEEYNFDFVLGMKITITYYGNIEKQETYPTKVDTSKFTIVDVKYENPKVYDYLYTQVPGGGLEEGDLHSADQNEKFYGLINYLEYVILGNNRFCLLKDYKLNSKVYLITSFNEDEETARGLYSFDPLE